MTPMLFTVPQGGLAPRRSSFRGGVTLRRERRAAAFTSLDEQRERTATDDEIRLVTLAERHQAIITSPQLVDPTASDEQREFLAKRAERERREVAMLAERLQAFADRLAREAS